MVSQGVLKDESFEPLVCCKHDRVEAVINAKGGGTRGSEMGCYLIYWL